MTSQSSDDNLFAHDAPKKLDFVVGMPSTDDELVALTREVQLHNFDDDPIVLSGPSLDERVNAEST